MKESSEGMPYLSIVPHNEHPVVSVVGGGVDRCVEPTTSARKRRRALQTIVPRGAIVFALSANDARQEHLSVAAAAATAAPATTT